MRIFKLIFQVFSKGKVPSKLSTHWSYNYVKIKSFVEHDNTSSYLSVAVVFLGQNHCQAGDL